MIQVEMSPRYHDQKPGIYNPCCVCGKGVRNERYSLHLSIGWEALTPEEGNRAEQEGWSQGWWPIGSDCLRKHPELRPYVHDSKKKGA